MTAPALIAHDRARGAVMGGLIGFTALSWAYLGLISAQMDDMSSVLAMPMTSAWTPGQIAIMFVMWAVMMAAMMLPSALPMVLAYDRMDGRSAQDQRGSTPLFIAGYGLVWAVFALGATGLQWVLHDHALVNAMGAAMHPAFAGGLLITAGLFQFSPVKRRGLGACRTPMGFLMTSWQEGRAGAARMGVRHGMLCFRCCGLLMVLLFVLGVMNLAWVAVLAVFVLGEKVAKRGEWISNAGGIVMILWGSIALFGG